MGITLVDVNLQEIDFAKRRVHILTGIAIGLSFLVMCLGSFVRNKDAGLSCPDWPLCYGTLIPYFDFRIFLEWFHRLLAGLLVIGLTGLVTIVLRSRALRQLLLLPMCSALLLLAVQVVLGGLTVLQLINPKIVSLHLINAVLFFGVLTWIFFLTRFKSSEFILPRPSPTEWLLTLAICLAIFSQIFLGGVVSTNFAGTVCPDFPTCFGSWWPEGALMTLQMLHRYIGVAIFVLVMGQTSRTLLSARPTGRYENWALKLLPTLVVLQIGLGVINVWYKLPAFAVLAHLGNAIGMFAISLIHCFETSSRYFSRTDSPSKLTRQKRVLCSGSSI